MNLLFAEDDSLLAQLFMLQAQDAGYQVFWAENGDIAVQQALSYQFDLIFMDIQMPVLDGISAMQMLRQLGYDRPIIAMSAEEVTEEGFDLVLKKPLHWEQVQVNLAQFDVIPQLSLQVPPELKSAYAAHIEESLHQLQMLADSARWAEFSAIVHQLKGSAGSFGFEEISQLADKLQQTWPTLSEEQKQTRATNFLEQCQACNIK
ncbi:MAG: response regulator [Gammaproteobacteria bacterium]|nr:response regulator [Gammaproteobacteria bacterium]MBU2058862.1 response regulator [Gammaproteobacteria bacterium]MBU2177075.1 response regulator [Gammaproteobacteria bacterium]MBU2247061.1 response regulator [Gammaproteobacteria bacterium]MBU2345339.1 response regulator [Gammaproteobacteria bacterium]